MSACRFCKIAAEHPPWTLSHGDDVVSFKPFGAAHPRHRIFVPIEHAPNAIWDPAVTARCVEEATIWASGQGMPFNIVINSGAEADQVVFHLHVHYIPRSAGDGLGYRFGPG